MPRQQFFTCKEFIFDEDRLLSHTAQHMSHRGELARAVGFLKRQLAGMETNVDSSSPALHAVMCELAGVLVEQGQFAEAKAALVKVLRYADGACHRDDGKGTEQALWVRETLVELMTRHLQAFEEAEGMVKGWLNQVRLGILRSPIAIEMFGHL